MYSRFKNALKNRKKSKNYLQEYLRARRQRISTKTSCCYQFGQGGEIEKTNEQKEQEMKSGMKKKVMSHLKEDIHEAKEQIADDKKLKKVLKKKKKK